MSPPAVRWACTALALAACAAASLAGPREDGAALAEQARAALARRDRPEALRLYRETLRKDPRHPAALAMVTDELEGRGDYAACASLHELATHSFGQNELTPRDHAELASLVTAAMACAAKLDDDLARYNWLKLMRDIQEAHAAQSRASTPGAAATCAIGRYAWERARATERIHYRLIDRIVASRNDASRACVPIPMLKTNLEYRRRALLEVRGVLSCPDQATQPWDSRIQDAAQDFNAAANSLRQWDAQCAGATRPATAAPAPAQQPPPPAPPAAAPPAPAYRPPLISAPPAAPPTPPPPPAIDPSLTREQRQAQAQQLVQEYEKDYARPRAKVERAVLLDPENAVAWKWVGIRRAVEGDSEGAVQAYRRALDLNPKDADAWHGLGHSLSDQARTRPAQWEPAIVAFQRALEVRPDNYATLDKLGRALCGVGRADEAYGVFETALRTNPRDGQLLAAYNQCLRSAGKPAVTADELRQKNYPLARSPR